ncbi:MAG: hypothetical protein AAGA17_06775 [Actinomycetota bacterium]
MRRWKWIGLAGILAVAGTGAVVTQRRRTRTFVDYEPDEIRDRLRARLAEADAA